uniref:Transmembrane protein 106C n=1 Tax=Astyanax mexicanus TaxID=7994 RepID=A0A3B1JB70_ASTMX
MGGVFSQSCSALLPTSRRRSSAPYTDTPRDDDSLDGLDRQEDIAQFPYVEFTGRDSITCPTCQGSGRIPSGQVNELVALIPYSDQRLQPQRTKQYVGLSVIVCLLVSALVAFFLFPRPVLVEDGGIRSVIVLFDHHKSRVLINLTSSLNFHNGNFFTLLVENVNSQVLYMKTVIGTRQLGNVLTIQPLSQRQMNFTVSMEISGSLSYVYAFCTMPSIKVHNIVVFMQTSVKTSYMYESGSSEQCEQAEHDIRRRQIPIWNPVPPSRWAAASGPAPELYSAPTRNPAWTAALSPASTHYCPTLEVLTHYTHTLHTIHSLYTLHTIHYTHTTHSTHYCPTLEVLTHYSHTLHTQITTARRWRY